VVEVKAPDGADLAGPTAARPADIALLGRDFYLSRVFALAVCCVLVARFDGLVCNWSEGVIRGCGN